MNSGDERKATLGIQTAGCLNSEDARLLDEKFDLDRVCGDCKTSDLSVNFMCKGDQVMVIMCEMCGEVELDSDIHEEAVCEQCLGGGWADDFVLRPAVDDEGVRCGCEDAPCCGC